MGTAPATVRTRVRQEGHTRAWQRTLTGAALTEAADHRLPAPADRTALGVDHMTAPHAEMSE